MWNKMVTEIQSTTTDGDTITGEMIIRFENITLDGFLKYRATIRSITGFGAIGVFQTTINEKALVAENNLDKRPDEYREAQTPPLPQEFGGGFSGPTAHLPGGVTKHRKIPYEPKPKRAQDPNRKKLLKTRPEVRAFLKGMVGMDQGSIIKEYRAKFIHTKIPDERIMEFYNDVHRL
jgi:hypothetical protein